MLSAVREGSGIVDNTTSGDGNQGRGLISIVMFSLPHKTITSQLIDSSAASESAAVG